MRKYIVLSLGLSMSKIKSVKRKKLQVNKKVSKTSKQVKNKAMQLQSNKNNKIIKKIVNTQIKKIPKKTIKEEKIEFEKVKKAKITEIAKQQIAENILKDYISKNIGSGANNILNLLVDEPNVDEKIAEILKLKLNETRRMLNLLSNYGLVKYNTNKDSNGWLTFVWYMDYESVDVFSKKVLEATEIKTSFLPDDCNDFFICKNCSKSHTMIVSFETAYDNKFKCVCGKELSMIEKEKAEELYKSASN